MNRVVAGDSACLEKKDYEGWDGTVQDRYRAISVAKRIVALQRFETVDCSSVWVCLFDTVWCAMLAPAAFECI